jgi:hypothetical protein
MTIRSAPPRPVRAFLVVVRRDLRFALRQSVGEGHHG